MVTDTEDRVRSFIAVEVPSEVKSEIRRLQDAFRNAGIQASWVREESIHLTLRFLGDISPNEREQIETALAQVCADIAPFQIELFGCGAFPNAQSARVLWAGISLGAGELSALAEVAEKTARDAGLDPDRKRFRPHVTLARIRDRGRTPGVEQALVAHADFDGGVIAVERVSLFASELRPNGAKHTVVRTFDLGIPN